ncbi:hypothetical protein QLX08_007174 [Tetragonisca angustula]|uniref:Uncharacterized protein n=1 Tax=Tetragonisca angustula TaxID=166442 RepID=A0AAW0ZQP2_9HYME
MSRGLSDNSNPNTRKQSTTRSAGLAINWHSLATHRRIFEAGRRKTLFDGISWFNAWKMVLRAKLERPASGG